MKSAQSKPERPINQSKVVDFNNEITTTFSFDLADALEGISDLRDGTEEARDSTEALADSMSDTSGASKAIEDLAASVRELSTELGNTKPAVDSANEAQKKYNKSASAGKKATKDLAASLKVAGGAGSRFGRVLNTLARNPFTLILTTIVGVMGFLVRRFGQTEEGADKLGQIMAGLSAGLEVLGDIAIDLGKSIFDAFSNPREAISGFIDDIKNRVVGVIQGLGEIFKGLGQVIVSSLSFDSEGIESALERIEQGGTRVAKAYSLTGVVPSWEDLTKSISDATDQALEAADAAAKAEASLQAAAKAQRSLNIQRAKVNRDLALTRELVEDTNQSYDDRLDAIDEIEKADTRLAEREIAVQRQRLAAVKQKNAQSKSSRADLDKEAELQAKIFQLQEQSTKRLSAFNRQRQAIEKQRDAEIQKSLDLEQAIRIAAIEDEETRQIAQLRANAARQKKQVNEVIKSESAKAVLVKQIEEKLARDILAVETNSQAQRAIQKKAAQDKELSDLVAQNAAEVATERSKLLAKQELERQEFASQEQSGQAIKDFKQKQAEELLALELRSQLERLNLIKQFSAEMTKVQKDQLDAEIALLEARIKGIGKEIKQGEEANLGFIDNTTQAVVSGAQSAISAFSNVFKERAQLLDQEISNRDAQIQELETQLQQEKALEAQGKANRVGLVEQEIAEEKAARDKAQKERDEAAKVAFVLDAAVQASNLVTAISGIYASLSTLPFGSGVPIATAISAALIGTFIASKAVAAQAAGFYKGGDTGAGNPTQESLMLGPKPYTYHRSEFVLPHQTYRKFGLQGKSVDEVEDMLKYGINGMGQHASDFMNYDINNYSSIGGHASDFRQSTNAIANALDSVAIREAVEAKQTVELLKKLVNKPDRLLTKDGRLKTVYPNGSTTVS